MKHILFTLLALSLVGCGTFGEKEETTPVYVTPTLANGEGGDAAPPVIEVPDPGLESDAPPVG